MIERDPRVIFTAAALSGIMSHARIDSEPREVARIALAIGLATAAALEAREDAETAPTAKLKAIR